MSEARDPALSDRRLHDLIAAITEQRRTTRNHSTVDTLQLLATPLRYHQQ